MVEKSDKRNVSLDLRISCICSTSESSEGAAYSFGYSSTPYPAEAGITSGVSDISHKVKNNCLWYLQYRKDALC